MTGRDDTRHGYGDPRDPAHAADPNPAPAGTGDTGDGNPNPAPAGTGDTGDGPANLDDTAQPSRVGRTILWARQAPGRDMSLLRAQSRWRQIGAAVITAGLLILVIASGYWLLAWALGGEGGNTTVATAELSRTGDDGQPAAATANPSQGNGQATTPPNPNPRNGQAAATANPNQGNGDRPAAPTAATTPPNPNPAAVTAVLPVTSRYPVQGVATVTNADENATIAVAPGGMSISGPSQVQLIQTPPDGTGGEAGGIPVATISDGVRAAHIDYRGQEGVQHELVDLGGERFAYQIRGNARVTMTPAPPSQTATPTSP